MNWDQGLNRRVSQADVSRAGLHRRGFLRASAAGLAVAAVAGPVRRAAAQMDEASPVAVTDSGYVETNGLRMYYQVQGSGAPLLLIHGAFMFVEAFGPFLPALAETRQVIGVDLESHGRTADIGRDLSYEQMADDTAAVLAQLGLSGIDVIGYSMGAGVGMQLAIRHPDLVRKLVLISGYYNNSGLYAEILAGEATMTADLFEGSPWLDAYLHVAPDPNGFPVLVDRIKTLDLNFAGFPAADVAGFAAPTQIIIGDSDAIPPEHAVDMFRLRGGGVAGDIAGLPAAQLDIVPAATHVGIIGQVDRLLASIHPFLDAAMPGA